ncbi:MAG: chloride channel protein [Gammaproteobacteria bacterium]|nr:chloride channel protein [Gammaproteobacteria bacterium]
MRYYTQRTNGLNKESVILRPRLPKLPIRPSLEGFRQRLASAEALPQLAVLAVLAGLLTGAVILAFRLALDGILGNLLPGGPESFESLGRLERLVLPVAGMCLLAGLFAWLPADALRFGVPHVMERLSRHQGYLPLRNALAQFWGGIGALAAGLSGGREGPAVHLGAASASLMGRAFQLPNNAIRTLVACGTAAAIAGSFNTPMAGVIFAMEVVMMEYTIGSFIPVILAAVTSTLLTHYFIGAEPAFEVAPTRLASLLEIPFIVLCGVVIGTLAAGYSRLVQLFARFHARPFWLRALVAGAFTGAAAVVTPEVMGVGYDTVNAAMAGQLAMLTLAGVVLLKSLTSAAAVGLGMPVGIIGPTFVIGAAIGGLMGAAGAMLPGAEAASIGFYVMLGMAAMMAAVLQAPLAALMAVLELTANPNVILPAMLVIVVATMVTGVTFRQRSVFLATLAAQGLEYPPNPVRAHLQRAGVTSIMNRSLARLGEVCSYREACEALARQPRWIVVESRPGQVRCLLNAGDLRNHVAELKIQAGAEPDPDTQISLLRIPGVRRDTADVDYRATIEEAQALLDAPHVEALCVRSISAPMIVPVRGVIVQENIDNYREAAL